MNNPTWSDVATRRKTVEMRDVSFLPGDRFVCPFCGRRNSTRLLKHATGHRCGCGALFFTQQAIAVHFKDREPSA